MRFMDFELAQRLEMAEAFAGRACAEAVQKVHPELAVAIAEIGGGTAVYAGPRSPITQAIGVGMNGPVTDSDFDRLANFFHSRGAACAVELCPLVDACLLPKFAERGYSLAEVSNVLARDLLLKDSTDAPSDIVIRAAEPQEGRLWAITVLEGFFDGSPPDESILPAMEGFFARPDAACFLAYVDGQPAGGGAVSAHAGVGGLFGASTLPEFRRRGVQSALVAARLR